MPWLYIIILGTDSQKFGGSEGADIMKQYFTEESKPETFFTHEAQLLYVSKVEKCDCIHPRMMHSHKDLVEILLITGGEGSFFIHGVYYEVKCGDIVVFNSGVIHDELTTKDNAISLYCCAVKNLAVNSLRANALIPDGSCPVIPSMEHFSLLSKLYDSMFSLLQEQAAHASFVSQQLLTGLLYYLESNILEPQIIEEMNPTQIMSYRVKEYIDRNYSEDIQLQSVADT
ncbi:MAG: transcriptional regulator [Paenibacillaceae bacterium]|jgi:mannose-6-phosphate isomerase-like protein (cupin superfamily)|nr:transcriptional regulator [Paenibacillaceae bacterium]